MKAMRLGIIGSGFMGQTHAAAAAGLSEFVPAAIACGSRASEVASRYNMEFASSVEDLVARSDIDAVVVATPHYCHAADALLVIEAGKPVLIEKPMATTVADCEAISHAAAKRGITVAVGYHQRFRKNVREARRLLRNGSVGDVLAVQISMPSAKPSGANVFGSTWQWWRNERSVGHILNSGPHAIDLLRWYLLSEVQEVVSCCTAESPYSGVETTTMAVLRMRCGTLASLYSTNELSSVISAADSFHIRIAGSRGVLDLHPYDKLVLSNSEGKEMICEQEPIEQGAAAAFGKTRLTAYQMQLLSFRDRIEGRVAECGSVTDGIAAVATCVAILSSSSYGGIVRLNQ